MRELARGESPWLLSVNIYAPHHPFDPPGEYLDRYDPAGLPSPKYQEGELDNKPAFQKLDHVWAHNSPGDYPVGEMTDGEARQVKAAYYAMIEHIDDQVGRMLEALDEAGGRENTIVIFMSDHGEMLGDHGLLLKGPHFYDEAVRVPMILRWPGHFQEGLQASGLVELVDLAPTLLEAAGLPAESRMQGRSFLSVLTGSSDPSVFRDSVYSEYLNAWTHQTAYATMLRTSEEKIVVYHGSEPGELYDLANDPDEFDNLWDDPAHADRKLRLLKAVCDRIAFTADPEPARLGPF
jgi:arylsulfatase A-like enzyme